MSKAKNKSKETYQPPTPPRWKGRDSLDLAYQLNHRFFTLMSDLAKSSNADAWLMTLDRDLWSKLDAAAMARAAHFPFVILNVQFLSEAWWRDVINGSEASATLHDWPASVSEQLMNETLIFAWHTAKWDRGVARLSLGMSLGVAELIAALNPHQLASISAQHSHALKLRWADDAEFWARFLVAARDDEEMLSDIHLHANLLLCGELNAS